MGHIEKRDTFMMSQYVGDGGDNKEYELRMGLNFSPMIHSTKTGKTYVLGWSDIIHMAIEAGVDDEST